MDKTIQTLLMELRRVPNILFEEMTVHPLNGFPAIQVRSREEYKEITGENFDPKHLAARWNKALAKATGSKNGLIMPYVNIYGPANGGQAVPFNGVGKATEQGVLIHELGHAMSLPHWGNSSVYPKRREV